MYFSANVKGCCVTPIQQTIFFKLWKSQSMSVSLKVSNAKCFLEILIIRTIDPGLFIILVLSVYTSYCSSLGAIIEVLWTERGVGCADNRPGCSLLMRQVCDLLTCLGIALPVHGSSGFKWLPNHWALHVYFSLAQSEGGMGARNAEKAPYLWIDLINQQRYIALFVGRSRTSCMKIRPQCRLEPTHLSLKLPMAEIRCTAP